MPRPPVLPEVSVTPHKPKGFDHGYHSPRYPDAATKGPNQDDLVLEMRTASKGKHVDWVQDTVVPSGEGITSKVLASSSAPGRYTYEYVVTVPDQPTRHLTTIFSLASDCLVTFTTQTKEADFPAASATLDTIGKSFSIAKL